MTMPAIRSLQGLSLEEALRYLDTAEGDELAAAFELAHDRNRLDGSDAVPDDAEVHHALFLLRSAQGLSAPSFDTMRVELRESHLSERHLAAANAALPTDHTDPARKAA